MLVLEEEQVLVMCALGACLLSAHQKFRMGKLTNHPQSKKRGEGASLLYLW